MKKKKEEGHANSERWLLTYSDLITLLMIFFVIMYASSNVDAAKYKSISESFSAAMGGGKSLIGTDSGVSVTENTKPLDTQIAEEDKMENVKKQVDEYLKNNNMSSEVSSKIDERGLVVSFSNAMFFDTGKADIRPESQKKLIEIGKMLNQLDNYVRIEGHTDNVPIKNNEFNSNWQLSSVRATNVTELLISQSGIKPQRLSAVGYGEYRPVGDNSSEQGRSKNRRVDIIIINTKFNQIENNKK